MASKTSEGGGGGGGADDENQKFAPGSDLDVSEGPIVNRGCTDIICLLVYIVHWVAFLTVMLVGVQYGNPNKLWRPRDYRGDYCGISINWNGGLNLDGFDKGIYMMNITEAAGPAAKQLACSTASTSALSGLLSTAEMETYMCACCKTPCDACDSTLSVEDLATAADVKSTVTLKMQDLTNRSRVMSLFSPSGPNEGLFNNIWSDASRWFVQACVTSCDVVPHDDATTARAHVFVPAPDMGWRHAWNILKTGATIPADIKNTINTAFEFKALPISMCPHDAQYCVPYPGIRFTEAGAGFCTFQVPQEVISLVGTTAEALNIDTHLDHAQANIGAAMGDTIDAMDTIVLHGVIAFVTAFVFLVLLRFMLPVVVWLALLLVLIFLAGGGAAAYVRSGQCEGQDFVDTTTSYGSAAFEVGSTYVAGGSSGTNETLSGNGADYRGGQVKTRGGRKCQNWASQSPHAHTTTAANYPNAGLEANYCRNPIGSQYIWCYTQDPDTRWELCDPLGVRPWDHDCPNGYAVPDKTQRKALEIFAYILWVMAGIWVIIICCMCSRIALAIALNQVAALFIQQTPHVIFVPVLQAAFGIMWCMFWAFLASFLLSQVPDGYTPTGYYTTYAEAYGTADTPGKCTENYPSGFVWKYEGNLALVSDPCSGNQGDTTGITPACWRCGQPRYMFDTRFVYALFVLLWNNAFLIAIGQCTIAGAVGVWFFARNGTKHTKRSVCTGLYNCFRYHCGSLAFGSFIIALVQLIRYIVMYYQKQMMAQKNRVAALILKITAYCLWCFEKCLKFICKQAYIQIALLGKNFCISAKNAFYLVLRNAARFGTMMLLGSIISTVGVMFIVIFSCFIGYYLLLAMHPEIAPIVPMFLFIIISFVVGKLFMTVFELATDCMLQCFIATEEMKIDRSVTDFVPGPLKTFVYGKE